MELFISAYTGGSLSYCVCRNLGASSVSQNTQTSPWQHKQRQNNTALFHVYLTGVSTPRKEVAVVKAVQRDVEHAGVMVERFLGAVAMMNVL